jgi:hypothetical protein
MGMQRRTRAWVLTIFLAALVAASLACDLTVGGPTPPGSPIPVSTEAAGQLKDLWKSALDNSQNGEVSVIVTEEQLTSFMALKLEEQADPPLRDVQVYLRDSRIQIFGTAKAGTISTTARVSLAVAITPEGQAKFSIDKADFGPVPVPSSLLDNLSSVLNEAFTGQVGSLATGLKIKSVLIADGQMGIIGTVTK